MVAAAGVRGWGWPVAAALAGGFIALLAFHGERPETGLARFRPAGLLAQWPIEQVTSVELRAGTRRQSFHRDPGGGWVAASESSPVPTDLSARIETGLKLLHNSAPQRADLTDEQLAEFGLDPPRLSVGVRQASGAEMAVEFGGLNPLGLERYARILGRPEILLMPSFVAEPWEPLVAAR
jgi:hypothetical protein